MSAATIVLLALAAALLGTFVWLEARSPAPLLPVSFFRNRTASVANLAGLLLGAVMLPMFFFLSLYLQQVLGYPAIKTGLAFLVVATGMIASSGLAQALVTRAGARVETGRRDAGLRRRPGAVHPPPAAASFTARPAARLPLVALALGLAFVGHLIASATGVCQPTRAWPPG